MLARRIAVSVLCVALSVLGVRAAWGQSSSTVKRPPLGPSGEKALHGEDTAQAVREARDREADRRERRSRADERTRREDSRSAFGALDRAQAMKVLESELPAVAARRFPDGPRLQAGERVVRYLDDDTLQVEDANGARALVETMMPVRSDVGKGEKAPIDLRIESQGDRFTVANPLVPYSIGADAGGGVSFPDPGFSVRPVTDGASAAVEVEGKLHYANVLTDTDFLVTPAPTGAETSWLLRSAASPQQLTLEYDLGEGLGVRAPSLGPDSAEIVRGADVIAATGAVFAYDADGVVVPVSTRVEDERLVIDIPHRDRDLRYPLVVDPMNAVNGYNDTYFHPSDRWSFQGSMPWYTDDPNSLYIGHRGDFAYPQWSYGAWVYTPVGSSFVWRFETWSEHAYDNGSTQSETGISRSGPQWESATWTSNIWTGSGYVGGTDPSIHGYIGQHSETHCVISTCNAPDYRTAPGGNTAYYSGDRAVTQLVFSAPWNIQNYAAWQRTYWGAVYVDDPEYPTFSNMSGGVGSGWYRGGTARVTGNASDAGLGIRQFEMQVNSGNPIVTTLNCDGDTRCKQSWSLTSMTPAVTYDLATQLPEGIDTMTLFGTDVNGHRTVGAEAYNWQARIDRTAPTAAVAGALYSARKTPTAAPVVTSGSYPLAVTGITDPATNAAQRSGVKTVVLEMKNLTTGAWDVIDQRLNGACPGDNCAMPDQTFDFRPENYAEGLRSLRVRVLDRAGTVIDREDGNTLTVSWQIVSDRSEPKVTLSGALKDSAGTTLQPGTYDLTVDAKDPDNFDGSDATYRSGVKSIEIKVDGVRRDFVTQSCLNGNCPLVRTWSFATDAYPPGPHTITVVTSDQGGTSRTDSVTVVVGSSLSLTARGIGIEEYFAYRSLDTGAGSQALVNVANGNLVWHHRPIENAGRGMSTMVDLTYNSLSSVSDLGHAYNQIGDGFSLAISGLTRVNEPLDVRAAAAGVITLTDADGTMHRFTKNAGGAWFDPPAGVNLWLRKFYDTPANTTQAKKVWAATRPDGTTYFFDACGYQQSVEDRNGNVMRFEYDSVPVAPACSAGALALAPRLRRVVDAEGVATPASAAQRTLTIDYAGVRGVDERVSRITDHAGRQLSFTYDAARTRLTGFTEAANTTGTRSFTLGYEVATGDVDRDLASIQDPRAGTTRVTYSPDSGLGAAPMFGVGERVTVLTDRDSLPTRFGYRTVSPDRETDVDDRRGKRWVYRTDPQLRPTRVTNPLGTPTTYVYDSDNNVTQLRRAAGIAGEEALTLTAWNPNGLPTSVTDPGGHVTAYAYRDSNGMHLAQSGADAGKGFVSDLTKVTRPKGTTVTYTYDAALNGNARSRTDESGYRIQWDYTASGLLQEERRETDRDRFAKTAYSSFDPNGLPQLVVDARGNETADTTDGRWKLRYDAIGNLLDAADPRGTSPTPTNAEPYTTEYEYDPFDRLTLERTPLLSSASSYRVRRWEYDANDNQTAFTDGTGARSEQGYTKRDLVQSQRTPPVPHEGATTDSVDETRFGYDAEENLISREGAAGVASPSITDDYTTTWSFDAAGRRVVQRRLSRGTSAMDKELVTSWAYDRRDNVTGMADPRHNVAAPLTGTTPEQAAQAAAYQRLAMTYDIDDNVTSSTENPSGAGNVPARTTFRCYDDHHNLTSVTDPRGTNRACPAPTGAGRFTSHFGYDERDLRTSETDAIGRRTETPVRGDGRPSSTTSPRGVASTTIAGDFTTTYTYDAMGDLLTRSIPWAPGQYGPRDWKIAYQRNQVGDPTTIVDARKDPSKSTFTNTFFDTGELRSTERPSHWTADADSGTVQERGAGGDLGEDPELGTGDDAGDFGHVARQRRPGLLPRRGATTFGYDAEMRLTSVRDVAGTETSLGRDGLGRLSRSTMPYDGVRGIDEYHRYDRQGNLASVDVPTIATANTTPAGQDRKTTYSFDQFDRLTQTAAPGAADSTSSSAGATTEFTSLVYDINDNVVERRTPRGTVWRYTFDDVDRTVRMEDPRGKATTYTYDPADNRLSVTPPNGQGKSNADAYSTFWGYDGADQNVLLEEGRGHADGPRETNYTFDEDGNLTVEDGPGAKKSASAALARRMTRRSYDGRGLLWAETTGTGSSERTTVAEYDAIGNLRRRVNPAGVDPATELVRTSDPGDAESAPQTDSAWTEHASVYQYNADGQLTDVFLPWGRKPNGSDGDRWRMSIDRDDRGRAQYVYAPVRMGDANGRRAQYGHFANGWIRSSTDNGVDPVTLNHDYDEHGNQVLWQSPDKFRRVLRTFWPNGALRERQAIKDTDPATPTEAGETRTYRYGYNPNGSRTLMLDARSGREARYAYDELERQIWTQPGDYNKGSRFSYDDNGNLLTRETDGRLGTEGGGYYDGKTTTFTYDEQDREVKMVADQRAQDAGSVVRTTDTRYWPSGEVSQRERTRSGSTARVIDQRYLLEDGRLARHTRQRQGATGPPLKDLAYGYDDETNTSADPAQWGNGSRSKDERGTHAFNARGQLVRWTRADGSSVSYDVNGDGAITKKTDKKAGRADQITDYCYLADPSACFGTAGAGTGDRLVKARRDSDTTTYAYDRFGQIKSASSSGGVLSYTWDKFERMVGSRGTGQTSDTSYTYDGLDRRETRSGGDGFTQYAYIGDTEALTRELVGTSREKLYDYDSRLQRVGQAIKVLSNTRTYYAYAMDANGSVEGLEQADGTFATGGTYSYDPYGALITNTTAGTPAADNPFRFQGFYHDEPVDAYDMQARHYRPELGRFLSADRFESAEMDLALQLDPSTNNRYVFAGADPVDNIEFDGHGYETGETGGPYGPLGHKPTRETKKRTHKIISKVQEANVNGARRFIENPGMFGYGSQPTGTRATSEVSGGAGYAAVPAKPIRPGQICATYFQIGKSNTNGCAGSLSPPPDPELAHVALDVFGLVPLIGEPADALNSTLYASEGRYAEAAASAAAVLPFAGWFATGGKWAYKGGKEAAEHVGTGATKAGDDLPGAVGRGRYAGESIPARGTGRDFTAPEREAIDDIGSRTGCHTCGARTPGTKTGHFVPDHQPPSSLLGGGAQRLFPHCLSCSREQGLAIARMRRQERGRP